MTQPKAPALSFDERLEQHLKANTFTVGAALDRDLLSKLWSHAHELPNDFGKIERLLHQNRAFASYEIAASFAKVLIEACWPQLIVSAPAQCFAFTRSELLSPKQLSMLARRYAKHPLYRESAKRLLDELPQEEVALPTAPDARWDQRGWRRGVEDTNLFRHDTGLRRQHELGVPPLENIAQLRQLLGISSSETLGFLLLASDDESFGPYHTFTIPKARGGHRLIAAPSPQLRAVQQKILHQILATQPAHDAAHGFIPGRSTVTNAAPHVGKEIVFKFDLHDFFGTISYWRVVGLFSSLGYNPGELTFSKEDESVSVAPTLARLCCYTPSPSQVRASSTPQGAPTSPAISNLICRSLDHRLHHLAAKLGGDYTRYADDLTFSFNKAPDQGVGRFRWWVNQICHQEGFLVREDKFRVIRASQQQRVTGIVVNEKTAISRKERRRFRAIIHNCEQHGVASQARGVPRFESYLLGYAAYMNMVHPEEGAELLTRVRALVAANHDGQGDADA